MTMKRLAELAVELRDIDVLDGCTPEEVEVDSKSIEVLLHDNPLVPQLVFEVMASIARAHPKDVTMRDVPGIDVCAITAQF